MPLLLMMLFAADTLISPCHFRLFTLPLRRFRFEIIFFRLLMPLMLSAYFAVTPLFFAIFSVFSDIFLQSIYYLIFCCFSLCLILLIAIDLHYQIH